MQEEVGFYDFFKRGAESGDKRCWQLLDEAYRICQQHFATCWELYTSCCGIQCGEQLISNIDVCFCKSVQEC